MKEPADLLGRAAVAATALFALGCLWLFRDFAADDSYIYMRYVANLVETGELVYNPGEHVTTLTSPLLTLLEVPIYSLFGEIRLPYQICSLVFLAGTCAVLWRAVPAVPGLRPATLTAFVAAPTALYWTVGGMEVAPLTLIVAAVGARVVATERAPFATTLLAGLAFLTRYDTAPFMTVVVAGTLARESWGTRLRSLALGAALPVAWLVFSGLYYGDIFPTSVHVKSPSTSARRIATNLLYMGHALAWTGVLPLLAFVAAARIRQRRDIVRELDGPMLLLGGGLALQATYAATMATVHMMFGFRALLPYMPAAILLIARWAAPLALVEGRRRTGVLLASLAFPLLVLQGFQARRIMDRTVQGFATVGELQRTSLRNMIDGIPAWLELVDRVREHWEGVRGPHREGPRIAMRCEGSPAFRYREAYVFGELVSYRDHVWPEPEWADYVLFETDAARPTLPLEIASVEYDWEGGRMRAVALYNPQAHFHLRLPDRVHGDDPNVK